MQPHTNTQKRCVITPRPKGALTEAWSTYEGHPRNKTS